MADKKTPTGGIMTSFDQLNDLLNKIAPDGEMMDINPIAKIDEWIPTGWYLLNAAFSGSLFGGLPNRRSIAFAGDEGTGKTFLAMSIVRNAQMMGYTPIYCDSEGSIDIDFTKKLGVDTSNIRLQLVNTIEEMNHIMAQIVTSFEATIAKKKTPPKIMLILDSLGNLTSSKERDDSITGSEKRDMTKQQAIRKMFRVNGVKFAKLGIPFIVTNHVYDAMSMFTAKEISGGMGLKYNASIIFVLGKGNVDKADELAKQSKAELKKRGLDEKTKIGITVYVKPFKGRFARPIPIKILIPFFKKPNPYVGLQEFLNWEDFGVIRGSLKTPDEYAKLSDADKKKCHANFDMEIEIKEGRGKTATFTKKKVKGYVFPNDTAKTLVVKHLGGEVPITDLFTDKVFTDKLLHELDEKVIKPTFSLPDIHSLEDLAEIEKELFSEQEVKENEED
jgi:RecA/RadA recombinase